MAGLGVGRVEGIGDLVLPERPVGVPGQRPGGGIRADVDLTAGHAPGGGVETFRKRPVCPRVS